MRVMIKFFRKIRYELMETNKAGKPALPVGRYLKYAIGEIVLVVICILIALLINNWNENKTSLKLEKTYYCKIAEELKVDIINIDSSIVTIDKRLERSERFLKNL